MIAGLMVLGLLAFLVSQASIDRPGTQSVRDDVITMTVSAIQTDATASFQIRLVEGSDAEHEIQHVYENLSGVPGVGQMSLDATTLRLEVAYDDSVVDEETIRQRLAAAGFVGSQP
jgi:copper chaperone CopZ